MPSQFSDVSWTFHFCNSELVCLQDGLQRPLALGPAFSHCRSVAMKRQRLVSQGALSRMFQQAAEAWKQQEYHKTIETLERAAGLDPANASIQLDLGRAYGLRYDYSNAERCM